MLAVVQFCSLISHAIPLFLCVAIANFLLNLRKSRRNSKDPLIDWDFVLVMQPMILSTLHSALLTRSLTDQM